VTGRCDPGCLSCVGCGPPGSVDDAFDQLAAGRLELDGGDVTRWHPLDALMRAREAFDEPAEVWITAPVRALTSEAIERLVDMGVQGVRIHIAAAGEKMTARLRVPEPRDIVHRCEEAGLEVALRIAVRPASLAPLFRFAREMAPRRVEVELDRVDFGGRVRQIFPETIELALRSADNVEFSRRVVAHGLVPPCLMPQLFDDKPHVWPRRGGGPPNDALEACGSCDLARACAWRDTEAIPAEALARAKPIQRMPARRSATRRPVPAVITKERRGEPLICVAPWTTVEIVDPDGLAHQCCTEWTRGARGGTRGSSILEVWNGRGYQRARALMAGDEDGRGELCLPICPRLHDGGLGERHFRIQDGSDAFVKNQLLLAEDIALRRTQARGRPLYLALCPSTYCNYDCIMCVYGRTPRRDIDDAVFDELPELWPTLRSLTLLGGEPLANPRVMTLLREFDARRWPDASIDVVTNGSLLTEKALRHLRHCSFGTVVISVNAGDADTYGRVQRGIEFEALLANLRALAEYRRTSHRWFHVNLSFVLQPASLGSLIPFGELARSFGFGIRLMALNTKECPELDFYDDPQMVARVTAAAETFAAWCRKTRPEWVTGVMAVIDSVHAEALARTQRSVPSRLQLPVVD
jgi:molybdenum cofactor biosynthesis enzyme MoaA